MGALEYLDLGVLAVLIAIFFVRLESRIKAGQETVEKMAADLTGETERLKNAVYSNRDETREYRSKLNEESAVLAQAQTALAEKITSLGNVIDGLSRTVGEISKNSSVEHTQMIGLLDRLAEKVK